MKHVIFAALFLASVTLLTAAQRPKTAGKTQQVAPDLDDRLAKYRRDPAFSFPEPIR